MYRVPPVVSGLENREPRVITSCSELRDLRMSSRDLKTRQQP